tara:strand:+ start:1671 stop:2696 length:1026 start_codon:yes stop_codon:yes gene_type:complete
MRILSALLIFFSLCSGLNAHKLAPSLLELRELPGGVIGLTWKTPVLAASLPNVVLPESCRTIDRAEKTVRDGAVEQHYTLACAAPVSSLVFAINGLSESRSAALLRWYGSDGGEQQSLLGSDEDRFSPALVTSSGPPILQFTGLGIKHILIGSDHLLFVLGLLLIAGHRYRLLIWISAFTVGHSITLFLVSMGVIPHWPAMAEWLIAASVLVMALYAGRYRHSDESRNYSKGFTAIVALFGVLHGLGFAAVLEELRVPSGDMLPALLGFNIGIELGQIFFIAMVAVALMIGKRLLVARLQWRDHIITMTRSATIYVMGSVAAYWMIDRGLILFEATFRSIY